MDAFFFRVSILLSLSIFSVFGQTPSETAPSQAPAAAQAAPAHDLASSTLLVTMPSAAGKPLLKQKDKECYKKHKLIGACDEITLSTDVWTYERLFSFLNAIAQDTGSIQSQAAVINPTASNGTQTDALVQSFQLQAGFSQAVAVQNQLASQMASANLAQQSSLLQQQSSLGLQLANAQAAYLQATNRLQNDQASQQPAATISGDTLAQTEAQNSITSINTLLTQVNGQLKAPTYNPSFVSGNGSVANATAAPAALSGSSLLSGSGSVTFSATKQLDLWHQFFWERVSRILESMVKPDTARPDDSIYWVRINAGIFPIQRRKQLLQMEFSLSCDGATEPPTVIDIYPRSAAVNITNTKYRDNQTALGAVLSLFSIGINASYNREHLQASQLLGQSSYITGYGVGQSTFGWKYGIPLGDDQLTSDTRQTAALITAPKGCKPKLTRDWSFWMSANGKPNRRQDDKADEQLVLRTWQPASTQTNKNVDTGLVASVDFNRVELDPAMSSNVSPPIVSVTIHLNKDIDQQTNITANGTLIRFARDTFARAVASAGTGGLLETSSLGANSWIPVTSRTLLLFLDATAFGTQFPEIIMAAPSGTYNLTQEIGKAPNCPTITVSGQDIKGGSCGGLLPSLSYQKPSIRSLSVVRVLQGTPGQTDKDGPWRIMITDLGVPASQTQSTGSATSTDIRVVSNVSKPIWSSLAEVYQLDKSNRTMVRLNCLATATTGAQLICDLPSTLASKPVEITDAGAFQIIDVAHVLDANGTVGSVKGWADLVACRDDVQKENCKIPTFQSMGTPTPDPTDSSWNISVDFVNVDTRNQFEPNGAILAGIRAATLQNTEDEDAPLEITFNITPAQLAILQNNATLVLSHDTDKQQQVQLTNLMNNLRPTAVQIASDFTGWSGSNLLAAYTAMSIGQNGALHPILCNSDFVCQVSPREDLSQEKKADFIFLHTKENVAVPLMSTASGALTFATYKPPQPAKGQQQTSGQGAQQQAGTQQQQGLSATPNATLRPQSSIVDNTGQSPFMALQAPGFTASAQTTVVATQSVKPE